MMMRFLTTAAPRRWVALVIATGLMMPSLAGCGSKGSDTTAQNGGSMAPAAQTAPAPQKVGLSTKQKVVLLAGAALLFYLYKKDIANNNNAAASGTGPNGKPQLYREDKGPNKGAVYYRDPQTHKPVWVTAPSQPIAVPADQVQQYAPNYQQYQGQPAPPVPSGQASVPATQYDPSLANAGAGSGG